MPNRDKGIVMARNLFPIDHAASERNMQNHAQYHDIERRGSGRINERQHVAIFNRRIQLVCDLVNLSLTGAKLRIVEGAVPLEGEPLALTLLDGTSIATVVSWVNSKFVGLVFLRPLTSLDPHLTLEELGRYYFGKAVALQKQLSRD